MLRVVIVSFFWKFAGESSFFAIQLLSMMVLSRILTPRDFGISATVMIIYNFMMIFNDGGIKNIIIQRIGDSKDELRRIFGTSLLNGFVVGFTMFALSPLLAFLFDDKQLTAVTMVMSSAFLFTSISRVSSSILEKKFDFKKVSFISFFSSICSGGLGIAMAYLGFSYWSLIAMILCKVILDSLIMFVLAGVIVPIFDLKYTKNLLRFGTYITIHNISFYFSSNIEKILISKFFGTPALGFYSRSFTLLNVYQRMFPSIVVQILNSVFGNSYKRNDAENAKIYYDILRVVFFVGGTGMATIGVWAPEVNALIWGSQWSESAPYLAILSFSAIAFTQTVFSRVVFITFNAENKLFKFSIFQAIVTTLCCALGIKWGTLGVVVGYACANWIGCLAMGYYLGRYIIKGTLITFAKILIFSLASSFLWASINHILRQFIFTFAPDLNMFGVFIGLFALCPIVLFYFIIFQPAMYEKLKYSIKKNFIHS